MSTVCTLVSCQIIHYRIGGVIVGDFSAISRR